MKWIKLFENFRKLNESVEDSLEDIKWFLVDYDNIVPYDYYPNSTNLLVYRISGYGFSKADFERIERLANEEDWNVINKKEFLIFYKKTHKNDRKSRMNAILNWLNENYKGLKPKMQFSQQYYCNSIGESLFYTNFLGFYRDANTDVNVETELWTVPKVCVWGLNDYTASNLLDSVFKSWLRKNYDIRVNNIYYED
jgi:hypothetical protein